MNPLWSHSWSDRVHLKRQPGNDMPSGQGMIDWLVVEFELWHANVTQILVLVSQTSQPLFRQTKRCWLGNMSHWKGFAKTTSQVSSGTWAYLKTIQYSTGSPGPILLIQKTVCGTSLRNCRKTAVSYYMHSKQILNILTHIPVVLNLTPMLNLKSSGQLGI